MTRKRAVRFDQADRVCVVRTPSKKERKEMYWSKKELKRIRIDLKCTLKSLAISGEGAKAHFHWRGLEHIRRGTMCVATNNHQAFVRSVLSMQKYHRQLGLQDDKAFTL